EDGVPSKKPSDASLKKLGIKNSEDLDKIIRKKTKEMKKAASELNFEKAAEIRDAINELKDLLMVFGHEET
ncbi:MAG: UvrB/UvrC motif-containing protein, partial [Oligoflexales bacterium]|nr:UvrB/UvrC motif-containing protein [Oligoflexales bacterium]